MTNPQFIEEQPLSLTDVKGILKKVEKRDEELNYRTTKAKEFLENLKITLSDAKKKELFEKLQGLNLTRIKEEHMMKIIDFLPKDTNELKVILQSYPLSLSKKDQETIVGAVKEFCS